MRGQIGQNDFDFFRTVIRSGELLGLSREDIAFEFMSLHCLRHSNATFLLNSWVDIKMASEHLRHSCISTTGNIYSDVLGIKQKKIS